MAKRDDYATVNGVRLHYVSQGKGPLVLLLHGFPEFWYSWRHQLPFLARKFHVVAPDMRGYNTSDKPSGLSSYYMEELVNDVRGLIQYFGEEKAIVIAHDWGGVIAWDLAAFHPEVVDKLVIMNAPHPLAYMRELKRNPRQRKSSWYVFMFQLPKVPEWYLSHSNYAQLDKILRGWTVRKETFSDEDLDLFRQALSQPGCLTAGINYYRALFRNPSRIERARHYPRIKVPTQIIWAEKDHALCKGLTRDLDKYFHGKPEIRYIPDCSHWVQQEQPERVNELLAEFLF